MSAATKEPTVQAGYGIRRAGRALIGWMTEAEGTSWLAGRELRPQPQPDDLARVRGAIQAVARRETGVDQGDLVRPIPAELAPYVGSLKSAQASASLFTEGFDVGLVDLGKVCALQPHVCTESTTERMVSVDVTSLKSIAELTIPLAVPGSLPVQFDGAKWSITSPNPNLRIVGQFQAEVNGLPGLGFMVGVSTSFLQVANVQGRYVLRDGYHRAVGLLERGVRWAPAFVKDFTVTGLGLPLGAGLFGQEVWLGERPPLLLDYQNNDVACTVRVPVSQKVVVIQAIDVQSVS